MADISVTAGNVLAVADSENAFDQSTAGATITAGQALYYDTSTLTWKLADCDSGTAAVRNMTGIALNTASSSQPLRVQTAGLINLGATLAVGTIYCLSATAGAIMPAADLATGKYTVLLGVALTAANLRMRIYNSATIWP